MAAAAGAERTGKRHRQFVRDRLGVKYAPAAVREVAATAIRAAVQCKDNPADLINVALDELVRQRCELPGYSTLDAMAASIRAEVNGGMFAVVAARLGRVERERLERLLVVDPVWRRSEFDRLKDPAGGQTKYAGGGARTWSAPQQRTLWLCPSPGRIVRPPLANRIGSPGRRAMA